MKNQSKIPARHCILHSRLLGRTGAFAQARPPAKQARRTGEAGGQNLKSKILQSLLFPYGFPGLFFYFFGHMIVAWREMKEGVLFHI